VKAIFFDYYHVSLAPYCDVYVTERNALNVVNRIKKQNLMFTNVEFRHVMDFIEEDLTSL